jgi:hypothetical protein
MVAESRRVGGDLPHLALIELMASTWKLIAGVAQGFESDDKSENRRYDSGR